ncbi:MAG: hypothetical protein JXA97_10035 [Anaerolineales bacterium]|nr:hypothetical protein [Anaerolineales bacterium]
MSEMNFETRQQTLAEPRTDSLSKIFSLVLKAVALGMGVCSLVLTVLPGAGQSDTLITLLSIGLAALAMHALQQG